MRGTFHSIECFIIQDVSCETYVHSKGKCIVFTILIVYIRIENLEDKNRYSKS